MVYEIISHLPLPDFLSAGRACKNWRISSKETGHSYLKSIPPLATSMKNGGRKCMYFHNSVNGDRFKSKVMPYVKKDFKGISGGFIAFENCYGIWFANPVTSENVEFYKPLDFISLSDRSILTKVTSHEDYLVLVLYRKCKTIHASRAGTSDWVMYSYSDKPWEIVDMVVCDGHVFGLTSDGHLGTIVLSSSSLSFRKCRIKKRYFKINAKLVSSSDEQLMVAEHRGVRKVRIYRADMGLRKWVVMKDLGDNSLFIDDYNTYRLCDASGWGGRTNSVYYLCSRTSAYSVFSYTSDSESNSDDELHEYRLCTQGGEPFNSMRGWYFPTLIYSVDRLRDDYPQPQLQPGEGCSKEP